MEEMNRCTLKNSKSLTIIGECILGYLRSQFLDEAGIEKVLELANAYLIEESQKPQVSTVELAKAVASQKTKIQRLTERYAELDGGHAATTMLSKIQESEAMLDEKQLSLASATRSNSRPQPIP